MMTINTRRHMKNELQNLEFVLLRIESILEDQDSNDISLLEGSGFGKTSDFSVLADRIITWKKSQEMKFNCMKYGIGDDLLVDNEECTIVELENGYKGVLNKELSKITYSYYGTVEDLIKRLYQEDIVEIDEIEGSF